MNFMKTLFLGLLVVLIIVSLSFGIGSLTVLILNSYFHVYMGAEKSNAWLTLVGFAELATITLLVAAVYVVGQVTKDIIDDGKEENKEND